jgi:hypothetical protein
MTRSTITRVLAAALLLALPTISEAGPPLICHPFKTADARLLPWGTGEGWNTPDARYDVQRLTADLLALLTPNAPVLSRMENMRRAAIYAGRDSRVAHQLLRAVVTRASATGAGAPAVFDAGYLIESYKQAAHLHKGPPPSQDGYAMVVRAISTASAGQPEMEFAASLMTRGDQAQAHLRRARAAAASTPLLAANIESLWQ